MGDQTSAVDLNADLGEGYGRWELTDDTALLEVVTSANVACGYHAGDPATMRRVCELAVSRGVAIGAQVGYRDIHGFGRRFIDVDPEELAADVLYQLGALDGFARVAGDRVRYVKPHGALYNAVVHHEEQAAAVVEAVTAYDPSLPVLGLPGSRLLELAAREGLVAVDEAFADRGYTSAGTLVPRSEAGALVHDADSIAQRCVAMVTTGAVTSVEGTQVPVAPRSICVHGDSAGAVAVARRVQQALTEAGVTLSRFS